MKHFPCRNLGNTPEERKTMDTRVSAQQLRAFMERAYEKEGFEKEDAAQIADVLMQADLFGIVRTSKKAASTFTQKLRLSAKHRFPRCLTDILPWGI